VAVQGSGRSKLGLGILFQRLASWSGESWNLGVVFGGGYGVQRGLGAKPYIFCERNIEL